MQTLNFQEVTQVSGGIVGEDLLDSSIKLGGEIGQNIGYLAGAIVGSQAAHNYNQDLPITVLSTALGATTGSHIGFVLGAVGGGLSMVPFLAMIQPR